MLPNPSFKIHIAIPKDVEGIAQVRKNTWLATNPNKKAGITTDDILEVDFFDTDKMEKRRESIKNDPNCRTWVATYSEEIIGFCGAYKEEDINEIGAIYMLPQYQRKGIGKLLIGEVLKWLGNDKDIRVNVVRYNTKAINFYNSVGFKKIGDVPKSKSCILPSGKILPEVMMIKNGSISDRI